MLAYLKRAAERYFAAKRATSDMTVLEDIFRDVPCG